MVNFEDKKVIHTECHAGSREYQELIKKGYIKVGVCKVIEDDSTVKKVNFYWDPEFFNPYDKYLSKPQIG